MDKNEKCANPVCGHSLFDHAVSGRCIVGATGYWSACILELQGGCDCRSFVSASSVAALSEAALCEDEGCDHFGTPHVCVTAESSGAAELPELDVNHPYYAEAGREWNQRVPKDFAWSPFEVRLIEERMQRERQLRDYKAKYEAAQRTISEHAAHCQELRRELRRRRDRSCT